MHSSISMKDIQEMIKERKEKDRLRFIEKEKEKSNKTNISIKNLMKGINKGTTASAVGLFGAGVSALPKIRSKDVDLQSDVKKKKAFKNMISAYFKGEAN